MPACSDCRSARHYFSSQRDQALSSGKLHYFRIPKTGSSLSKAIFHSMNCSDLIVHDHGDGCIDMPWCNGTEWEHAARAFVVLREPTDRFASQFEHMHAVSHGQHKELRFKLETPRNFLAWLVAATAACHAPAAAAAEAPSAVACVVDALNEGYRRLTHAAMEHTHRVVLWPQAFFVPRTAVVLCYSRSGLTTRLGNYLGSSSAHARCSRTVRDEDDKRLNDKHANGSSATSTSSAELLSAVSATQLAAIRRVYASDARLWERHCGGEHGRGEGAPMGAPHEPPHGRRRRVL